ncbi:hypothetical protein K402DRAFT_327611 [Aulographum hederae CBS 113979]|uniref:DUF1687-domain-containing protein n=1 Tax=Aulographum hederae CBS 113979 TaxID=1176131 RepID=A0A6G1H893_9PEZI|nr:hypothetical protein K402DRAFT_327611 [Aulographum hederae CBS 113979]
MFRKLFKEAGAKDVVTLFHAPSVSASTRVLTLLKQANANAVSTATEDQASTHHTQSKAERTEFDLDVTEAPPTADQLKNILEYVGASSAGQIIKGASNEAEALRKLKENDSNFIRPLVVDWNMGKAIIGEKESEILNLIRSIPKETDKIK